MNARERKTLRPEPCEGITEQEESWLNRMPDLVKAGGYCFNRTETEQAMRFILKLSDLLAARSLDPWPEVQRMMDNLPLDNGVKCRIAIASDGSGCVTSQWHAAYLHDGAFSLRCAKRIGWGLSDHPILAARDALRKALEPERPKMTKEEAWNLVYSAFAGEGETEGEAGEALEIVRAALGIEP